MRYIGIDPGKAGAVAWIDIVPILGNRTKTKPGFTKSLGSLTESELIEVLTEVSDARAVVEIAHAFPKMGSRTSFVSGRGYGVIIAALTAAKIPFTEVSSQRWQKAMGCSIKLPKGTEEGQRYKEKKQVLRRKAEQLFPREKITNYNCDALLLAKFCQQHRHELF